MEASNGKGNSNEQQVNSNIIVVSSASPNQADQDSCEERLQRARILSTKHEPAEAINEYKRIIEQGCDAAASRLNLGLALAKAKHYEEAAGQYRIIIKRDPKNWAAHWTLAQTLILELGQYEEGLREARMSRQLDDLGDIGFTYDYYLGRALEGLERYKEAITHYETYIDAQSKISKDESKLFDAKRRVSVMKRMLQDESGQTCDIAIFRFDKIFADIWREGRGMTRGEAVSRMIRTCCRH